jgi:hypothetical protein
MTISTGYVPDYYDGDDSEDTFTFSWRILAKTDLVAKVLTVASGVVVDLVVDTDFTIDPVWIDAPGGGQVVLTAPVATGDRLFLIRDTSKTQLVNIVEGSPFPAAAVTKVFDRLTMMIQELVYLARQSLKFRAVSLFKDIDVPDPEELGVLGWHADLLVNLLEIDAAFLGGEEDVTTGDATKVIVFSTPQADTTYEVIGIAPNWLTGFYWTTKTINGFTIVFSNPAPSGSKVGWRVSI